MRTTRGQHPRHFVLDLASSTERPSRRPYVKRRELHDPSRAPGVDMRTSAGRRFSRIADDLIREFGSDYTVCIRELAVLKFSAERLHAAVVAGDEGARVEFMRLSDLIERRETDLRAKERAGDSVQPSRAGRRLCSAT
jgi:hypothetical protein